MNKLAILSDSSADITSALASNLNIEIMPLGFSINGKDYLAYADQREITNSEFYNIVAIEKPVLKTSALLPQISTAAMESHLKNGEDVIYIAFSSGMSSTFQTTNFLADELREKYPNQQIYVIDSLSACVGVTVLLTKAASMRDSGCDAAEIAQWVEENKLRVCHYFVVDDLDHLRRGGRLSAVGAVVGTALSIKPMIHLNNEGKLIPREKIRGAQNVIPALGKRLDEAGAKKDDVYITHTNSLEQAQRLEGYLHTYCGVAKTTVLEIGPVVGCHTGPGALGIVFFADKR